MPSASGWGGFRRIEIRRRADARPLRRDTRPVGRQSELSCSGAEEYEPDHGEDQYRETRGYCQKGKHGRARLGLTGFSRGFDDLIVFPRCHGALASLGVEKTPVSPCGVTSRKQRLIPDHVPDFRACDVRSPRPRIRRGPPRGPCPAPRNQLVSPRLTPLGDSLPRRLETRFPGGILLGRPLRFRSIPWPPAPTGKAFCAFRS